MTDLLSFGSEVFSEDRIWHGQLKIERWMFRIETKISTCKTRHLWRSRQGVFTHVHLPKLRPDKNHAFASINSSDQYIKFNLVSTLRIYAFKFTKVQSRWAWLSWADFDFLSLILSPISMSKRKTRTSW